MIDKEEEMVFEHFGDDYSNNIDLYAFDFDNDVKDSLIDERIIPSDIAKDTLTLIVPIEEDEIKCKSSKVV